MASDDELSEPPAVIQVGLRQISVDPAPLPGKARPERYLYRVRDDASRYVLGPRRLDLILVLLLMIVPAVGAVALALVVQEWRWTFMSVGFLGAGLSLFIFVLPAKVSFDFDDRRLIIGRRGMRRRWSLDQVVGVQLCSGGMHRIPI